MANKKDKKRKDALKKKSTIEALKFQAKWGFGKQFGKIQDSEQNRRAKLYHQHLNVPPTWWYDISAHTFSFDQ